MLQACTSKTTTFNGLYRSFTRPNSRMRLLRLNAPTLIKYFDTILIIQISTYRAGRRYSVDVRLRSRKQSELIFKFRCINVFPVRHCSWSRGGAFKFCSFECLIVSVTFNFLVWRRDEKSHWCRSSVLDSDGRLLRFRRGFEIVGVPFKLCGLQGTQDLILASGTRAYFADFCQRMPS